MSTTYSLSLVVKFLEENNMQYEFSTLQKSANDTSMIEDGLYIQISNDLVLTILTHPIQVYTSFAEVASITKDKEGNYKNVSNVVQFDTPNELFAYIKARYEISKN